MADTIHQTKYPQFTPEKYKNDENIRFSYDDRCITKIGEGLSYPEKVIADAYNVQETGTYKKLWNENLNKIGENSVSAAYKDRDNNIRQWKDLFNNEVDCLAKELENIEECDRVVLRKQQYFSHLARASQETERFRKNIPDKNVDDKIDNLLQQEMFSLSKADGDMRQCSKDLKECSRKLKNVRTSLMSEVEAKAMTLNVSLRCQHMEPLLSCPYVLSSRPIDQMYNPNNEEDWSKNLDDKIQNSLDIRKEASKVRCRAEAVMKYNLTSTADAWQRTTNALIESVQRDERRVHNIQKLLKTIGENISSTNQRIESFHYDLKVQDRGKALQSWRLQMMTYRPATDHIRDDPIKKLDEEVSNIESRSSFIFENLTRNKSLLKELTDEKWQNSLELEKLTKKLYIERENCLGLRRTISIEPYTSLL